MPNLTKLGFSTSRITKILKDTPNLATAMPIKEMVSAVRSKSNILTAAASSNLGERARYVYGTRHAWPLNAVENAAVAWLTPPGGGIAHAAAISRQGAKVVGKPSLPSTVGKKGLEDLGKFPTKFASLAQRLGIGAGAGALTGYYLKDDGGKPEKGAFVGMLAALALGPTKAERIAKAHRMDKLRSIINNLKTKLL